MPLAPVEIWFSLVFFDCLYYYFPAYKTCNLLLYWDQSANAHVGTSEALPWLACALCFHSNVSGLHTSTGTSVMG